MSLLDRYRAAADHAIDRAGAAPARPLRVPLTAQQHILHLLLTVLTGGLWGIVWLMRAWRGNPQRPSATSTSER